MALRRFSGWVKNLALLVGTTLACFLVLEIGLRVVFGNPPRFLYPQVRHVPMPYGYKLEPGQSGTHTLDKPVRANAHGFRGPEWRVSETDSATRVVVLGDSFTFGNNAREEDLFVTRLQTLLTERGQEAEVWNAGIGGWNVDNEAEFFVTEGAGYRPDAVVVAFFNNDFQSPQSEIYIPQLSDDARIESRPAWLRWAPYRVLFMLKRSALVVYLRDAVAVARQDDDSWHARLLRNEVDLDADSTIAFTYSELLRIRDAADELGIPMHIAVLPSVNTFWLPRGPLDWVDHLHAFARSNGIGFSDVADAFWPYEGDTNRFFGYPWDNHYNADGHALVAEYLATPVGAMIARGGDDRDRTEGG